ncbi:MAG: AMP-binding protein [Clostridia bacterium]
MNKDNCNVSMIDFIKNRNSNLDNYAYSYYGKNFTYKTLFEQVNKVAFFLAQNGVKSGDVVAMALPNIPDAIISFYATNAIGAVANVIHPLVPSKALEAILKQVPSKILFVLDVLYLKHKEVLDKLDVKVVICSATDFLKQPQKTLLKIYSANATKNIVYNRKLVRLAKCNTANAGVNAKSEFNAENILKDAKLANASANTKSEVNAENIIKDSNTANASANAKSEVNAENAMTNNNDIAVYLHSGGTTGVPKTVMLSNFALNSLAVKAKALIADEPIFNNDGMLMVLPLFHAFGLGISMHTALCSGVKVILVPLFKIKQVCKIIKKQNVSFIAGVPTMFEKMLKEKSFFTKNIKNLRNCYCGGEKVLPKLQTNFDSVNQQYGNNIVLCEGYGLTETCSVCCVNTNKVHKFGSVGKPLIGMKIKIINKIGESLPPNEIGEICIAGDTLMSGYYNDINTTNQTLIKDKGVLWVKTGDCGYLDNEGFLFFKERYKRMIKIAGMDVFPLEIEEIVSSLPSIKCCVALEQTENNKSYVKLLVQMQKGVALTPQIKQQIIDALKEKLMKYSLPKIIEERENLPLTELGKVDWNNIK